MMMPVLLLACGGSESGGSAEPAAPPVPKTVSITDGKVVPASTASLVIEYDMDIVFNHLSKVQISQGEITSTEVQFNRKLVIGLSLSAGKSYTVTVPGDAVLGVFTKEYAETFTVSFSTEKGADMADASKVSKSLTNPAATAEARGLYALLLENYGRKQFSGAMGEVGWGTGFTDMIGETTGKYPAIVGFDYLHLPSSPSNWIDYGDITPVRKIWEAGSIPAMTWHWNVPVSESSDNTDFRADNNNFKASNVLIEGTWENKVAVKDVEKLAGYLRLLQDAGIPVLWRPFHEAAGDYKWGSWFWWGNSGTEVTKKLWVWLRDKLTGEYGLNNLIWVWTVQTSSEGKPAPMSLLKDAYPGDDVVDIVGTDIYADNTMSRQTDQFAMLHDMVDGKKMVALTECGNLVDVDSAFSDGALWSFFMGWYEMNDAGKLGFFNWNTAGEWKKVLDNPLVLNRGDFSVRQ